MKSITLEMIDLYKIRQLGFDFMGYTFSKPQQLSFHHLIIPKRMGGKETIDNGAILRRNTSHDYLHRIEAFDYDMFLAITSEMIDENVNGKIDKAHLCRIRDILECFENEYSGARTSHGKLIIQPRYVEQRIRLDKI